VDKKAIGERLRTLRGTKSREEIAMAVRVTANAIWMYEAGQRCPNDETKILLANYFGKTVQDIFYS
jgi:DNA-binding XRE family transcriptional regulator